MSPPNDNLSLTATDNPSNTTAFMLGEIRAELRTLNNKIAGLEDFRLKMYLVVGAISTAINLPTLITLIK
jgi:hypothetical protein